MASQSGPNDVYEWPVKEEVDDEGTARFLLSENEQAMIWFALLAYNCGPEEADPKLYETLEKRRQKLIELFE